MDRQRSEEPRAASSRGAYSGPFRNRVQNVRRWRNLCLDLRQSCFFRRFFDRRPETDAGESGGLPGRFGRDDQRDVLHLLRRRSDAAPEVAALGHRECHLAAWIWVGADDDFLALAKSADQVHPLARLAERLAMHRCSSLYRDRSHTFIFLTGPCRELVKIELV